MPSLARNHGARSRRRGLTEVKIVADVNLRVDGVYQTRKVDRHDNQKSEEGAPIQASRIPVDPFVLIERRYMEVRAADEVVVGHLQYVE